MNSPSSIRRIVLDSGPLIALAKLDRLEILPRLFDEVLMTQAVWRESQFQPEREDAMCIAQAAKAGWIERTGFVDFSLEDFPVNLGAGEISSIALALSRQCPVVLDDKSARRVAVARSVSVTGTVDLLLHAKRRGQIDSVTLCLEKLRQQRYFISGQLVEKAKRLAGE